ncbi:kinase [Desmospora activa]|uniref:Threonine kinase n=1 Tax=Desmospora activa DSM 45169 TaxID=1121389 RepID=A0A2T4ZAB1_9BACL|nr:kinase [Desmospora activa]PTM58830.1 threonine kinase [Desmospora activa DSM 45169]
MRLAQSRSYKNRGVIPATGKGKAFGTFGELLQGVDGENGLDFLVTFPIQTHSYATFYFDSEMDSLQVNPSHKKKSFQLISQILMDHGYPPVGRLEIFSEMPEGKGLASSSADLVAAARSIENCLNLKMSTDYLLSLMRTIEPTDGVMYKGVVSFFHRKVELCRFLGTLPPLTVVGIDEGGKIDTVQFNNTPKPFTQIEKKEYHFLHQKIVKAIAEQDVKSIGEVSTRSAQLNQKIRPKRLLDSIICISEEVGGIGVAVAHSGTYLGILLDPRRQPYPLQLEQAQKLMGQLSDNVTLFHSLTFE